MDYSCDSETVYQAKVLRGKYDLCFKGSTMIQNCVTVALAGECHFAKQLYTESKMGPVSMLQRSAGDDGKYCFFP